MHIVLEIEADNPLIKEYLPVLEAAENLGKIRSTGVLYTMAKQLFLHENMFSALTTT